MLTFEKVLKVFQAYLDDDPLYEVVQTSHGYTLMAWDLKKEMFWSLRWVLEISSVCFRKT